MVRALRTDVVFLEGNDGVQNFMESSVAGARARAQRQVAEILEEHQKEKPKQAKPLRTATFVEKATRRKHHCYYKRKQLVECFYKKAGWCTETSLGRRLARS